MRRVFTGTNVAELLEEIKEKVGDEVVITSTTWISRNEVQIEVLLEEEEFGSPVQDSSEDYSGRSPLHNQVECLSTSAREPIEHDSEAVRVLRACGFSEAALARALRRISLQVDGRAPELTELLGGLISVEEKVVFRQRIMLLLGASGVGKTTTAMKLAAKVRSASGIMTAILSLETDPGGYRGVALDRFSRLYGIPCHCLESGIPREEAISRALERLRFADLIFIDTPALRSASHGDELAELTSFMSLGYECEVALVIPAYASVANTQSLVDSGGIVPTRTILTKLDETPSLAGVIEGLGGVSIPISFFSLGPCVPDDLEPASLERLAWMFSQELCGSCQSNDMNSAAFSRGASSLQ